MKFELFMSLRYLKAKRKQTFISLITWISIGGVAVGVMALIVVISVMTGMQNELRDKILGTYSHIVVASSISTSMEESDEILEEVKSHPRVTAASAYIHGEVMISSSLRSSGAVLRGVDPMLESGVTKINEYMRESGVDVLSGQYEDGEYLRDGIVLGDELAAHLGVNVGETVEVISPKGRSTPMGIVPRIDRYYIAGLFHSGMYEYDSGMVIISLKSAQHFFGMNGRISGIEARVEDLYEAGGIARELQKKLGFPYYVRDWMEMNETLFAALKLEKTAIFIILVLIVFVAAFNIVSTMIMVTMEKGRDIAILKTMGATRKVILRIFFLEGTIIGIGGTVLGNVLGLLFCTALDRYQFIKLPADIYPAATLAVEMNPFDFALISGCALFITMLSAVYPAWNASRLDPAEALRYE
ncbi:MAG: ABC transporter permease [bacterium]|nr:MAG: ABC transporter permease [bacterium]